MIGNLALESYFQPPQLSLDVSENILEQLDKNNFVGAVIDLKKAFDNSILFSVLLSLIAGSSWLPISPSVSIFRFSSIYIPYFIIHHFWGGPRNVHLFLPCPLLPMKRPSIAKVRRLSGCLRLWPIQCRTLSSFGRYRCSGRIFLLLKSLGGFSLGARHTGQTVWNYGWVRCCNP